MSRAEDRLRILRLVESGAVTAEECARLLAELEEASSSVSLVEPADKARWMRVCVTDLATGRPKVNVRLPASLVDVGLRMGAQFLPGASGAQVAELLKAVAEGKVGKIADVQEQDGPLATTGDYRSERVEIFVE